MTTWAELYGLIKVSW